MIQCTMDLKQLEYASNPTGPIVHVIEHAGKGKERIPLPQMLPE